jgi:protein-L-isoaspartate(D-aspartate) O-methyltransferase
MDVRENRSKSAGSEWDAARREMVARQLRARGIRSERVLDSMSRVPRHLFVPTDRATEAYSDTPLPIGEGQTISQPYIVAAISEALSLEGQERVLEIGAGSGYQAAVLSLLARDITAIEAQPALAATAREHLERLGYGNVEVVEADGSAGWPAGAPYEAILVSAAAPRVPEPLLDQLAEGGRLVIPVGDRDSQQLLRIVRTNQEFDKQVICSCRFVPLLGCFGWDQSSLARESSSP